MQKSSTEYESTVPHDQVGFTHMCKADSTFENQLMGSTNPQKQTKEKKSHDGTNRCKKEIWQNPTPIHDKNSQWTRHREEPPQLDMIKNMYKKIYS